MAKTSGTTGNVLTPALRFEGIKARIEKACAASGRDPAGVEILAVTKYASVESVAALLSGGQARLVGESRVQDALSRWQDPLLLPYKDKIERHFIGHLQSNKAGKAAAFFDCFDSIDGIRAAETLNTKAAEAGRKFPVMLQVKLTDRETQSGLSLEEAPALLQQMAKLPNLIPYGYMGIAPIAADQNELRPLFAKVRARFEKDFPGETGGVKTRLSLGMTGDFEAAVMEGSTLVRIGSALFSGEQS